MDRLDAIIAALQAENPDHKPTPVEHRDRIRQSVAEAVQRGLPLASARVIAHTWLAES